jgi:hypothetical protein
MVMFPLLAIVQPDRVIRYRVREDAFPNGDTAWVVEFKTGLFGKWVTLYPYRDSVCATQHVADLKVLLGDKAVVLPLKERRKD